MGRVDIAIEVCLDSGIDGDDTQSANDLGRVGYLALAQCEVVLHIVHIVVDLHQTVVRHGQRAS